GTLPFSICVDPVDRFVYVANQTADSASGFSMNFNGTLNTIGPGTPVGGTPTAVAVDPSGRFVTTANFATNNLSQLRIDPSTGVLSGGNRTAPAGDGPISIVVTGAIR